MDHSVSVSFAELERPPVIFRDFPRDIEPQPSSFLLTFGREEWLEDHFSTVFRYSGSIIRHRDATRSRLDGYSDRADRIRILAIATRAMIVLVLLDDPMN